MIGQVIIYQDLQCGTMVQQQAAAIILLNLGVDLTGWATPRGKKKTKQNQQNLENAKNTNKNKEKTTKPGINNQNARTRRGNRKIKHQITRNMPAHERTRHTRYEESNNRLSTPPIQKRQ